ncbi:MAG: YHYH protein [Bacteroidetes bacterium]|nr:YHYH protein [Bacteroidota bacterium]
MKKINLSLLFCASALIGSAQLSPLITSWAINTTSATGYNSLPSNVQTVQYSPTQVYVSASCIPGYNIGPWTGNPNTPTNQNFVCKFTLAPVQNTSTPIFTSLGNMGLWSNGVAIFNPKDGQYWNGSAFTMGATTTGFNRNALVYEGVSFDNCLGHPAPGGCYHNHVNPACLYNATLTTVHSPIIGYAFDGFPVYGAYAYTNTNGTGAIKRMTPSFVLAPSTGSVLTGANAATAAASPTTPTTRSGGPPVNATYPLGNMLEDYVYVAGSGDLDIHNGRFCITPEYPAGTYAYFVTIDVTGYPVYPFVIGPTYYGTVQAGNTGPGGSHVTISEATTVYSPPTGLNELQKLPIKFTVMPNPTQDYLFIYMDVESKNNVKGKLLDAKGRTVRTIDYLQPSIAYSLDMTDLSNGIYFLVLESDSQKTTQKIIKSN